MNLHKDIRGNWAAESTYVIPGFTEGRLVVNTLRVYSGSVVTTAYAQRQHPRFPGTWVWESDKDFQIELFRSHNPVRCTSAFVAAQHNVHTIDSNALVARAMAFYKERGHVEV